MRIVGRENDMIWKNNHYFICDQEARIMSIKQTGLEKRQIHLTLAKACLWKIRSNSKHCCQDPSTHYSFQLSGTV